MTRGGLETVSTESGTEGSNPALSSGESGPTWTAGPVFAVQNGRNAEG